MQPWITVIVDGRSQHFEQLKLLKSYWQYYIVYIGLAAAVDSKFALEQLTAISMNKESSL